MRWSPKREKGILLEVVVHVRLTSSEAQKLDELKPFAGATRSYVLRKLLRDAKDTARLKL